MSVDGINSNYRFVVDGYWYGPSLEGLCVLLVGTLLIVDAYLDCVLGKIMWFLSYCLGLDWSTYYWIYVEPSYRC